MNIDLTIERVSNVAKIRKVDSCRHDDEGNMNSFVMFEVQNEMIGLDGGIGGHPVENLPDVLNMAHKQGMRRFDSLSFVTDVYFRTRPVEQVGKEYERGDLAKEFASDPFTDIVEALCVFTISWTGESRVAVLQYKLDDRGLPQFIDPSETVVESGEQIGGRVKSILEQFVNFCKLSPSQYRSDSE